MQVGLLASRSVVPSAQSLIRAIDRDEAVSHMFVIVRNADQGPVIWSSGICRRNRPKLFGTMAIALRGFDFRAHGI